MMQKNKVEKFPSMYFRTKKQIQKLEEKMLPNETNRSRYFLCRVTLVYLLAK